MHAYVGTCHCWRTSCQLRLSHVPLTALLESRSPHGEKGRPGRLAVLTVCTPATTILQQPKADSRPRTMATRMSSCTCFSNLLFQNGVQPNGTSPQTTAARFRTAVRPLIKPLACSGRTAADGACQGPHGLPLLPRDCRGRRTATTHESCGTWHRGPPALREEERLHVALQGGKAYAWPQSCFGVIATTASQCSCPLRLSCRISCPCCPPPHTHVKLLSAPRPSALTPLHTFCFKGSPLRAPPPLCPTKKRCRPSPITLPRFIKQRTIVQGSCSPLRTRCRSRGTSCCAP